MNETRAADATTTERMAAGGWRPLCRPRYNTAAVASIPCLVAACCVLACGATGASAPDVAVAPTDGQADSADEVGRHADSDGTSAPGDAAGIDPFADSDQFWVDGGIAFARADGGASLVSFEVPSGATSVVITLDGPAAALLTLAELSGPDGRIVVPKTWLAESGWPYRCSTPCPNRIAAAPGSAAFLVPNTPWMVVGGGHWTMKPYIFSAADTKVPLAIDASATVGIHAMRRPDLATRMGQIDVNLCMSGALGIDAGVALQHTRIVAALAEVRTLLAVARVDLGAVRAFDTPIPSMVLQHGLGADMEVGDALAAVGVVPAGINVLFVQRIFAVTDAGAVPVLGVAGGVPGPVRAGGGRRSGVVIGLELTAGQPDVLGRTLAHELGHYLGLFHTTEAPPASGPGAYDAIPDTQDGDANNLMHWSPTAGSGKLSPQQIDVLHGHPLVRTAAP